MENKKNEEFVLGSGAVYENSAVYDLIKMGMNMPIHFESKKLTEEEILKHELECIQYGQKHIKEFLDKINLLNLDAVFGDIDNEQKSEIVSNFYSFMDELREEWG